MSARYRGRWSPLVLLIAGVCSLAPSVGAAEADVGDDALDDGMVVGVPPAPVPVPAPEQSASSAGAQDSQTRAEAEERVRTASSWLGWDRVPIRWTGSLGMTWARSDQSSVAAQNLQLSGNTYVLAPYVAQVNGGIGINRSQVSSDTGSSGAQGLSLSGGLSLFSQSRWPFELTAARATASADAEGGTRTSTSQSFGVSQRYTPADSAYFLSANASQSTFADAEGARASSFSRGASFQPVLSTEMPQNLFLSLLQNGNRSGVGGGRQGYVNTELRANHSINMVEFNGFRLDTQGNSRTFRNEQAGAGGFFFHQLTTGYQWLPEDPESRLVVSGAVGASRAGLSGGGAASTAYQGSVNVALPFAQPLSGNVSASAFLTQAPNVSVSGQTIGGGLGYSFPLRTVGGYSYTSSVGTSGSLARTSVQPSISRSLSANGSQGLTRSLDYPEYGTLAVSFSQGLGVSTFAGGDTSGVSRSLSHGATLRWSPKVTNEKLVWNGGLQVQDQRSQGVGESWFQFIRMDAFGQWAKSWKETVSGSGAIDYSRQGGGRVEGSPEARWVGVGSLTAVYTNRRAWNVPRLNARAEYRLRAVPGEIGGADTNSGFTMDHALQGALDYQIGLLSVSLSANLNYTPGGATSTLYLTINRALGGTL